MAKMEPVQVEVGVEVAAKKKPFWKSKKVLTAFFSILFIIITDILNVPLSPDAYWSISGIAISYILGQAHVDAKERQAVGEAIKVANSSVEKIEDKEI